MVNVVLINEQIELHQVQFGELFFPYGKQLIAKITILI